MDTKKVVVVLLIIAIVFSVLTIVINVALPAKSGFSSVGYGSQQIRSGNGGIVLTIVPPSGSAG